MGGSNFHSPANARNSWFLISTMQLQPAGGAGIYAFGPRDGGGSARVEQAFMPAESLHKKSALAAAVPDLSY